MRSRHALPVAAFAVWVAFAGPIRAEGSPDSELKAQIDTAIHRLEEASKGALKWDGADKMDIRRDGNGAVADIIKGRILVLNREAQPPVTRARISLDHAQIRRVVKPNGLIDFSFVLPAEVDVQPADGADVTVTLKDGTGHAVIEAQTEHVRESTIAFASARVEDKKDGDWVSLGPLSGSTKVAVAADGSWNQPITFEVKQIEAFFAKNKAGGTVDRIAYNGTAAGPDLAALYRLRDRMTALQAEAKTATADNADAVIGVLADMLALFTKADGELAVEGITARAADAAPLFTLAKATLGARLDGMSGDAAKLRITYKHDGLALANSIPVAGQVPKRAVLDFGVEDVGTAPLRKILEVAATLGKSTDPAEKQRGTMQMLGAAAMLSPDLHIYDLTFDAKDFGVNATAEAKGSPISPKGYTAQGDVLVRSFDVLTKLYPVPFVTAYAPLLQELGTPGKSPDGASVTRFQLASAPPKWLQLNGSDVSSWFIAGSEGGGRKLRPAVPPMTGDDVRAVQQALAGKGAVPQTGAYDGATAVAVARFQKANGLNADGVVDAATRDKLGIKPPAPKPGGPSPAPPRPGTPGRPN